MLEAWQRPLWRLPSVTELDRAAIVTPVDVALARIAWQNSAPPIYIDLLEATPEYER